MEETSVKSCRRAGFSAMVAGAAAGRCASGAFRDCPAAFGLAEPAGRQCPELVETLVQYCSAAGARRLIPLNRALPARCERTGYRYCDVFLDGAPPARAQVETVSGIAVPQRLFYSRNHMWLDAGEDGCCHVGLDAFFARALERAGQVGFLSVAGVARPAAVVTARGVDVPVVFPNPLRITGWNLRLRSDPARLAGDPYGRGWLFEGEEPPLMGARAGLIAGPDAAAWMSAEIERMRLWPPPLRREDLLRMFHEFFSPMARLEIEP